MENKKLDLTKRRSLSFASNKLLILPKIKLKQDVFFQKQPIVFIHTSKTGGTTIDYLFKALTSKAQYRHLNAYFACKGEPSINVFREGCVGGLKLIENNPIYDLSKNSNVQAVLGHMPLPMKDYFKVPVSFISIVRDPTERATSLVNFLYQRNYIEKEDIETILLSREIDNLQTRALAGEKFMSGSCGEEVFNQAIKNIKEKFAIVAPIEGVETVMSIIADHFGTHNIAYSRAQVTGIKIIDTIDAELYQKLLERNAYDKKLYEYVKQHWVTWVAEHIESQDDNISEQTQYTIISSSFYSYGRLGSTNLREMDLMLTGNENDMNGFLQWG